MKDTNWIKVEDQLPPVGKCVLVIEMSNGEPYYMLAFLEPEKKFYAAGMRLIPEVTHWMQLPEKPLSIYEEDNRTEFEEYLDAVISLRKKEANKYQWQGEPVAVIFGYVFQEENIERPLYWYNFECCNKEDVNGNYDENHFVAKNGNHFALIPAVEVTYANEKKFLLANHCGIAVHKLTNGGWPGYAHFSLDGKFKEDHAPYFAIKTFDLEAYEAYENKRRTWQKKNWPVEFERMESLRRSAIKHHNPTTVRQDVK